MNEEPGQAISADPNWKEGDYYGKEAANAGLAVARKMEDYAATGTNAG